ncbi:MAG: hypothetical protein L0241_22210 [Planctomycetia bacterium]|nr:hypothetical protein [Planctomycetia bacterium]
MRLLLAGVVLAVWASTVGAQDKKPFVSKAGQFKVTFPGGAKPKATERDLGKLTQYSFNTEVKRRAFDVTYFDLPATVEAKKLFDISEKGAAGKDKILSSVDGTFGPDKLPSREILIKKDALLLRMVMILADDRLYLLTVGGPDDFTTSKEAYAFFETFEITK